jgi:hypothetical protein
MKNTLIITFIIFSFFSVSAFGQSLSLSDLFQKNEKFNQLSDFYKKLDVEISGSPYLETQFSNGQIRVGKTTYIFPLRYNIYTDLFEIESGDVVFAANKEMIDTLTYLGSCWFIDNSVESRPIYQSLAKKEGSYLLKRYSVQFTEGSLGDSKKKNVYPKFEDKPIRYFFKADSVEFEIEKNLKQVYAFFPEHSKQLKQFVKKNKVKKADESSLIALFNFIVELPTEESKKPKED